MRRIKGRKKSSNWLYMTLFRQGSDTDADGHDRATYTFTIPWGLAVGFLTGSVELAIFGTWLFCFGGLYLSPDLDVSGFTSRPFRRWQKLGLGWFWQPYRHFMKHRGLSHTVILGSLSRVLYLATLPILITSYALITLNLDHYTLLGGVGNQWPWFIIWGFLSLEASAWLHYWCDGILFRGLKQN